MVKITKTELMQCKIDCSVQINYTMAPNKDLLNLELVRGNVLNQNKSKCNWLRCKFNTHYQTRQKSSKICSSLLALTCTISHMCQHKHHCFDMCKNQHAPPVCDFIQFLIFQIGIVRWNLIDTLEYLELTCVYIYTLKLFKATINFK